MRFLGSNGWPRGTCFEELLPERGRLGRSHERLSRFDASVSGGLCCKCVKRVGLFETLSGARACGEWRQGLRPLGCHGGSVDSWVNQHLVRHGSTLNRPQMHQMRCSCQCIEFSYLPCMAGGWLPPQGPPPPPALQHFCCPAKGRRSRAEGCGSEARASVLQL